MIKSYDKLVRILDYVRIHPNVKLQTIANDLGITKSTLHRIIMELVDYHFLSRDESALTYKLGIRLLEYGNAVIETFDIRSEASDIITELNRSTLETIHLAAYVDNRVVYVDKRESQHSIRMYSLIGKEAPIHCTGVGKVIIALQNSENIENILKNYKFTKYTENTITSSSELEKEFIKIVSEGVAFDLEEHESGIVCIAAPIRSHEGKVIGSISITSITQRKTFSQMHQLKDQLISAADAVSSRFGNSGLKA